MEQISCQDGCIQLSFFFPDNYEWFDFQIEKEIVMYKEYASPNFKFWLLTKFMQLHTNLQLQGKK